MNRIPSSFLTKDDRPTGDSVFQTGAGTDLFSGRYDRACLGGFGVWGPEGSASANNACG
jgi:hypothetical protein